MVKKEISHDNFLKFVSCVTIDHVEHVKTEEELQWGEDRKLLSDLPDGGLYVTTGDDEPWIQLQFGNGYGVSLEPELALHWLKAIMKFYNSSEQKVIKDE